MGKKKKYISSVISKETYACHLPSSLFRSTKFVICGCREARQDTDRGEPTPAPADDASCETETNDTNVAGRDGDNSDTVVNMNRSCSINISPPM